MKTVKQLTAIFLCISMLLGMTTVFAGALNIGDTIEHTIEYGIEGVDPSSLAYTYEGVFSEGENLIAKRDDYMGYIFTAEKSGFYAVIATNCQCAVADEYSNGKAKNFMSSRKYNDENGNSIVLFYLEKGENAFLVANTDDTSHVSVTIEYYGEITDVEFKNVADSYILWYDAFGFEEEYGNNVSLAYVEHTLTFADGKTVTSDSDSTNFVSTSGQLNGEVILTFEYGNYKKDFVCEIYEIDYWIESIEIENLDELCILTKHYDGEYTYDNFDSSPVKTTIEFTNGTTQTINYNEDSAITLPNGKECYVNVYFDDYIVDGAIVFCAVVADNYYIEKVCKIITPTVAEEFECLKKNITYIFDNMIFSLKYHLIGITESNNTEDMLFHLESFLSVPEAYISNMFRNIFAFIEFAI